MVVDQWFPKIPSSHPKSHPPDLFKNSVLKQNQHFVTNGGKLWRKACLLSGSFDLYRMIKVKTT